VPHIARKLATFASIVALSALLVPSAGAAGREPGDITTTERGATLAGEAAERYTRYGVATNRSSLRVVRLADRSEVIGPSSYSAADLAALGTDGAIAIRASDSGIETISATAAPYWSLKFSDCFTRTYYYGGQPTEQLGWMDTCYHMHKVVNDGDGTWDYWDLHGFATVDATHKYAYTDDAYVHVYRCCGPTMYWFDWQPRGDRSGNCGTQTLSISYAGAGLSFGHSVCEWWLLTKYAAAGAIKVTWDGFTQGAREVALMSAVKVANGSSNPTWYVSWNATMYCWKDSDCPPK
jgi:hypothetical protein